MNAKILLIEASDFEGYPTGGSGTFSRNLIESFGSDIVLVGITTSKTYRVGSWSKKIISGKEYDYFPVKYVKKEYSRKPFIPARVSWFFSLRKYKTRIINYGCPNVFIQSPDTLLAVYRWKIGNICYRFAGLSNPLRMSRYKWARLLDNIFERYYVSKLKFVNTFLAAASRHEINAYSAKVAKYGINIDIKQFPTRVDTSMFYPKNKKLELRLKLGYEQNCKVIVTSGRLAEVKGWKLLLDSFHHFLKNYPDSYFIFVGNGEDKHKIEEYAVILGISERVKLTGFLEKEQLADFLNIADLYVMGSYFEGWPTSMIEALACSIPICSTSFKSANEILNSPKIGLVVEGRNPYDFVKGMLNAIGSKRDEDFCRLEVEKYTISQLKDKLQDVWQLL